MKLDKFKKYEIIKLAQRHSVRRTAEIVKLSKSTVHRVLKRAAELKRDGQLKKIQTLGEGWE